MKRMSGHHLSLRGVAIAVAGAAALGMSLVLPAHALGGSCNAWLNSTVGFTNAQGICYSLNGDTKARVTMDITAAPDFHSGWFTTTGKVYATANWNARMPGWPAAARVDFGTR